MVTKTCESHYANAQCSDYVTIFKVRCISTDEKPTQSMTNGSTLIEVDTGKKYMFNASSGTWEDHGGIIGDGDNTDY